MLFSSKISKIGKGENLSAYMPTKNTIDVYCYNNGIIKKNIEIANSKINLTKEITSFPYYKIIKISNTLFVSRLDKSMAINQNEE